MFVGWSHMGYLAIADEAHGPRNDEKTSAVHFVRFELTMPHARRWPAPPSSWLRPPYQHT